MSFNPYHANAITLRSLNLGASASLEPLISILIWNPVNSGKLSTVNTYSTNSPFTLAGVNASGLPEFLDKSMTSSPKPSPSVSFRLSNPGNKSNVGVTPSESGLNILNNARKSAESLRSELTSSLIDVAGCLIFTRFEI